ncbi:chaperonin 10-like protein [Lipomyces kononenkoae]
MTAIHQATSPTTVPPKEPFRVQVTDLTESILNDAVTAVNGVCLSTESADRSANLPYTQAAVLTPIVGKELDLQYTENLPIRPPDKDEVTVKIAWTGICRSDACFSLGPEPGFPSHDHVAGHEGIGIVVQSHDKSLMHRPVAARYIGSTCGFCHYCLKGLIESCLNQTNFPKQHRGTYEQYITVPWSALMPLPDWVFGENSKISPAVYTGALCSGSAALKSLRAANIRPGDVVIISGILGAIRHFAGMMAKRVFQARVIGLDWDWKYQRLPASFAGENIFDIFISACTTPNDQIPWDKFLNSIRRACSELRGTKANDYSLMADTVIANASSTSGFERLDDLVSDGGSIIYVGAPRGECSVKVPLLTLLGRQLRLQGSLMGGPEEVLQVMDWIRSGLIKPEVTDISLPEVSRYLGDSVDFKTFGKVVVRVNGYQ